MKRTTLRGMLKFLEISYQEFPFINLTLLPKFPEFLVEWHGSLHVYFTIVEERIFHDTQIPGFAKIVYFESLSLRGFG